MLDKDFKPAIQELRQFQKDVLASNKYQKLIIAVKRQQNLVYRKELVVFEDGIDDERNIFIVERLIKTILWITGGFEIMISGSKVIFSAIQNFYTRNGLRAFDVGFMSDVYDREILVRYLDENEMPKQNDISLPIGGHLEGRRIGFDAGGSDRKTSAVIDGNVVYSEEVVWFPKLSEDWKYQYDGIYQGMKTAIEKLGGDVDAIGVSSAGVYIDNEVKVSSLFIKVNRNDFKNHCQKAYLDVRNQLEKELGHEIPIIVANDGDVTALAGALDLKDGGVLGIAMGTSEAVGYVNKEGNLNGWISELAFAPVDFNKDAMVDEWSGDFGVGCKYFSQDAVIKLCKPAGIELNESLSLAEKLKYVQKLMENDDPRAKEIFETIGVYLAHALAYYSEFYEIKHVLLLGRVTSGKGGDIILDVCKQTLKEKYPEYSGYDIGMPSEYVRRVGQSIAAASLPAIKE